MKETSHSGLTAEAPVAEPESGEFTFEEEQAFDPQTVVRGPDSDSQQGGSEEPLPHESIYHTLSEIPIETGSVSRQPILRIGQFDVIGCLGRGGMGAVFRAIDTTLDRPVALKILAPRFARDEIAVRRFQNEARISAALDVDNIAKVYFIGEDRGLYFIAHEFVQGQTLRDLIRMRGTLSVAEALDYTLQIAVALAHLSAAGVVHRDIKPSNAMITPQGGVKLIDLGLARAAPDDQTDLTVVGTTLGTFDYISPEQAKDPRKVDVRSDIYSLGCTCFHMLTGEPPYPEGTVLQRLLDHHTEGPPDPTERNRRVPHSVSAVVQKMMSPQPGRRYQTAEELIADLRHVAAELGLIPLTGDHALVAARPSRFGAWWRNNVSWIATAAIFLTIVAFADRIAGWLDSDPEPQLVLRQPPYSEPKPKQSNPPNHQTPKTDAEKKEPPLVIPGKNNPIEPRKPSTISDAAEDPLKGFSGSVFDRIFGRDLLPELDPSTPPVATTQPKSIIVVDQSGTEFGYASLEAACTAAKDGDSIELRFDGRRVDARGEPVKERPIRISGKSITIRAAVGVRPVLEFDPGDTVSSADQRMISVSNGSLTMIGLDLVSSVPLTLPTSMADQENPAAVWAMVSLGRGDRARFQNVQATLKNPGHWPAGIVAVRPARGVIGMAMKDPKIDPINERTEIRITNSIFRGDGDAVRIATSESVRLEVSNSLFSIDSVLAVLGQSRELAVDAVIELRGEHLTAQLRDSFLRIETGSAPARSMPPILSDIENSIFSIAAARIPLVTMTGATNPEDFRRVLRSWKSTRNVIDGIEPVWSIFSEQADRPIAINTDEWKDKWGTAITATRFAKIPWASDWKKLDAAAAPPSAAKLGEGENSIKGTAENGKDPGADLDQLPGADPPSSLAPLSGSD